MKAKEPKFMRELHKVREQLARKWEKMTPREFLASLHNSAKEFKVGAAAKSLK